MAAPEIPKKQKAAVYDQPGTVSTKIEEIDVPEPGVGEVLINLYVSCSEYFSVERKRCVILLYQKPCCFLCTDKDNRTHSGVCHSDYGVMTNSVSHVHPSPEAWP
jgi:propanol-preferring alcohol dehydrogenase